MNKYKISQVLMLSLLAILLIIAPLLSPSRRTTYLYFITNLLIIALGAEAGLLSFFSNNNKPSSNLDHYLKRNTSHYFAPQKPGIDSKSSSDKRVPPKVSEEVKVSPHELFDENKVKAVGKPNNINVKVEKVKKCPSMPSLFFIGGGDNEGDQFDQFHEECFEDEDQEEISGQELFAKAENFIGNFYKQLKMQREESWKKIHGFYQRAF